MTVESININLSCCVPVCSRRGSSNTGVIQVGKPLLISCIHHCTALFFILFLLHFGFVLRQQLAFIKENITERLFLYNQLYVISIHHLAVLILRPTTSAAGVQPVKYRNRPDAVHQIFEPELSSKAINKYRRSRVNLSNAVYYTNS